MKNKAFKLLLTISLLVSIGVFILMQIIHYETNFIYAFGNIIVNIMLLIWVFRKKENKKLKLILIITFLVITILIPVYSNDVYYAPEGENAYLQGVACRREQFNMYGIKIWNK